MAVQKGGDKNACPGGQAFVVGILFALCEVLMNPFLLKQSVPVIMQKLFQPPFDFGCPRRRPENADVLSRFCHQNSTSPDTILLCSVSKTDACPFIVGRCCCAFHKQRSKSKRQHKIKCIFSDTELLPAADIVK